MRSFLLLVPCAVFPVVVAVGCSDDSTPSDTPVPEAGSFDTGTTPRNDSGANDAGGATDAGVDTGPDSGGADADAAPALNALFAHIDGKLVRVDPTTGVVTTVGATAQPWIVLAWDDVAKVARVVVDPYSPVAGAAAPKLGTINLCTGVVTPGVAITRGGNQVRRAEGLVQQPGTNTWFISYGESGTSAPTEFLSESNGVVDITTGVVTEHGQHQTHQDDGDVLTFIGASLKLLDVATANNTGSVYEIDKTTGAASAAVVTGPALLRVAYDPTRSTLFGLTGTGAEPNVSARSLVTVNTTTGAATPVGAGLAANDYAGNHFDGLMSAPIPTCP